MAIARDDLRRYVLGAQLERLHHPALDLRGNRRVGANCPRELAHGKALESPLEAPEVAVGLERVAGELEAERCRLGVDAVRPADAHRLAVLASAFGQRVAIGPRAVEDD